MEQAVYSPDGGRVAVCDDATTVRVWDVADGSASPRPLHHRSKVLYAAFNADGSLLLTATDNRTARLWHVASGELLAPAMRHPLAIKRVFFASDGQAHVVHEGDLESIWDLAEDHRLIEDLVALAQLHACGELDKKQGLQALDSEHLRQTWKKVSSAR